MGVLAIGAPHHIEHGVFRNAVPPECLTAKVIDPKPFDREARLASRWPKSRRPYWRT
jgi:hypothetical protein